MSELDELYMSRRLAIIGRAQDLTPSMQFDLAASSLSSSELEEAAGHFNPTPRNDDGWGFANVFEELLSREPRQVPVNDLATLQENLKQQGYLPPDHPADGTWGPDSYAAFNQFDRDNADSVRQGNSIVAGTVQDGINLFAATLPRSVFQGVIGTAKGLWEQGGETLERGGALGGAAEGAAIGAIVGNIIPLPGVGAGIGAGVGAIIGGIGGFLSSLSDNDNEADESILDALHPFNHGEWSSARNFFEDVGFVASAASLLRGGQVLARGAQALAPSTLRGSVLALDPVTKPGFVANLLGSAKGAAGLGAFAGGAHGLAVGDDFGDVFEEAAIGGVAGYAIGTSPVGGKLRDLAAQYGLKRIATNPVIKGINKTYTGAVMANIGGRYTGGLGSGEKETTLEKSIREAPVVIPEWADALGGLVLLPERLTPLGLGEIGRGARSAMGDTRLFPYFHAFETAKDATGRVMSKQKVDETLDILRNDPVIDLYMREQFGLHQLTKWSMDELRKSDDFYTSGQIEGLTRQAGNEVMRWYKDDTASKLPLIMAMSTEEPLEYAGYVTKLIAKGSGPQEWARYEPAQTQAENLALLHREGKVEATIVGGSVTELDLGIARAERQIAHLEEVPEPTVAVKKRLKQARENLEDLRLRRTAVRTKEEVNFVAASPNYMTARDWNNAADEYTRLVQGRSRAFEAAEDVGEELAQNARASAVATGEELETFIRSFRDSTNPHRYLPESIVDDALNATLVGRGGKKDYAFAKFLREKARHAGADVELADPSLGQTITENGYKLVATGDDLRFLSEARQLANLHNVGDYTKRASVFEALGMSPFAYSEKQVGALKADHLEGSLNQVAGEIGLSMNGPEMARKLIGQLESFNSTGHQLGPFVIKGGDKALIRRAKLLRVDLRQLQLDDINAALKLDEGFTAVQDPMKAAQKIKDAIHSGSAFGAEIRMNNLAGALDSTRMLASALRVEGLTGFSDFMRQFRITNPPRALTVAGGVVGAGMGAEDDGLKGALKGGIAGSLALGGLGYGGKKALAKWPSKSPFKPGTYGWLPNNLHNAAMALRYSLSFTFDIGRRMEQAQIASMKFGMPLSVAPKSYARRHFAEDFGGVDNVMPGLRAQLDEVMGSRIATNADDMDRRANAVGLTGFSQKDADAVYAHMMIKSGRFNKMQVRQNVHELGHYADRTGFERSLNFVLFPFSFQKKLLTTLGDFMLAEPARALLVHEGMRQWHEARENGSISEKVAEFNEKYLPMAETVARLNNLSYGLSPGRFFLEGMFKNKSLLGNVQQGLASVFVPSGAVTPLQQAAGKVGDSLVNFTSPIFLTGEDTENFAGIFEDFAPAVRDFRAIILGYGDNKPSIVSQQITALTDRGTENGGGAPWYQLRNFQNERRAIKAEYEDLATAFGYQTVDGFLNSPIGAQYKLEVEQKTLDLTNKYPTGALKSQYFENSTLIDEKAKAELINRPDRTAGEEMIVQLLEMENESEQMAAMLGMDSQDILPRLTKNIREIATQWGDDIRFRELYERWFAYRFGPIAEVLVA